MFKCVTCLQFSDLTESVIPRWMFETGAVFLHGYDKEGNKLCMYTFLPAWICHFCMASFAFNWQVICSINDSIVCFIFILVWFKVKLHVKDPKTVLDKKKYVAFWLERYAKKEPGMPLTVVFDMAESGIGNIVSHFMQVHLCYFF